MEEYKNKIIDYFNDLISNRKFKEDYIGSAQFESSINKYNFENYLDTDIESIVDYQNKRYLVPQETPEQIIDIKDKREYVKLAPQAEDTIFRHLVEFRNKRVYHYTSLEALIKIINTGQLRLSAIAGLNDRLELTFFDNSVEREISKPYHHRRMESFNSKFLLSCSSLKDDLNQWRLYGDDGRGVCLEFRIKDKEPFGGFYMGKIVYGDAFLKKLKKLLVEINQNEKFVFTFNHYMIWKHFFKSRDWEYEKEIRIIHWDNPKRTTDQIHCRNSEWDVNRYGLVNKYQYYDMLDLPIELTGIVLGPKSGESELNQAQVKQFLREKLFKKVSANVERSAIDFYR